MQMSKWVGFNANRANVIEFCLYQSGARSAKWIKDAAIGRKIEFLDIGSD